MSDDILNRIANATDWIEGHLFEDFPAHAPAGEACLSPYHFHRLFRAVTGLSPGLYIRKRRLTSAAELLLDGKKSVIEIALDAGYESQEAFTRAFKSMFGITPGSMRDDGSDPTMSAQFPITLEILQHYSSGQITMQPEFRQRDSFTVAGIGDDYETGQTMVINRMWGQLENILDAEKLHRDKAYGVCYAPQIHGKPSKTFHYIAGIETGKNDKLPNKFTSITIPKNDYAVFLHSGELINIEKTIRYIWQTWIPHAGYELADAPDFEVYDHRFDEKTLSGDIEIWIPIQKD